MGPLTPPTSGSIYLDTSVVIYAVERNPAYAIALRPLWEAVRAQRNEIVTSDLTILECLVAPYRLQDKALEDDYERFFLTPGLPVAPVSKDVLRHAARLRADHQPLKAPDHAATCNLEHCVSFLTNDRSLRNVSGLPVQLLQ